MMGSPFTDEREIDRQDVDETTAPPNGFQSPLRPLLEPSNLQGKPDLLRVTQHREEVDEVSLRRRRDVPEVAEETDAVPPGERGDSYGASFNFGNESGSLTNFMTSFQDFENPWRDEVLASEAEVRPANVAEALAQGKWRLAIRMAIDAGSRDVNELTNLVFFARHTELAGRALTATARDEKLRREWSSVRSRIAWPAVVSTSANSDLSVSGELVTEWDRIFWERAGQRFKARVVWAAREVGLSPGLLATNLLAEQSNYKIYLSEEPVDSYADVSVDNFYAERRNLEKRVQAYRLIGWDKAQKPRIHDNDAKGKKTRVISVFLNSGNDGLLANAVFLKYCHLRLTDFAAERGRDFNALSAPTRYALLRIAFNGGRNTARRFLDDALNGRDIFDRTGKPAIYETSRNATIHAAQAIHLEEWVFRATGVPSSLSDKPDDEEELYEEATEIKTWENNSDSVDRKDDEALQTTAWLAHVSDFSEPSLDFESQEDGVDAADDFWQSQSEQTGGTGSWVQESESPDPELVSIAEMVAAPQREQGDEEVPSRSRLWTTCFSQGDIERVRSMYEENHSAAGTNPVDRCSCIVMLNVALGQLLPIPSIEVKARTKPHSDRVVRMGKLTGVSVDRAMGTLVRAGFARRPAQIEFHTVSGRTAGTLRPERLESSVLERVLAGAQRRGCWYAFGLSIMNGYHSVLLLVDHTGTSPILYWLDQFSNGISDDVSLQLDDRITSKTKDYWDEVKSRKGYGYPTPVRFWLLRKPGRAGG